MRVVVGGTMVAVLVIAVAAFVVVRRAGRNSDGSADDTAKREIAAVLPAMCRMQSAVNSGLAGRAFNIFWDDVHTDAHLLAARLDQKDRVQGEQFRAAKGFPVNSGVFVSPQRTDGTLIPTDSYGIIDLQGSIRPKFGARNMILAMSINNVLNHGYATFVGVPKIGRLLLTKVSYTF